jgi:hypothetical protein
MGLDLDVKEVILEPLLADLAVVRIGSYHDEVFLWAVLDKIGGFLETSFNLFFELAFLNLQVFVVVLLG